MSNGIEGLDTIIGRRVGVVGWPERLTIIRIATAFMEVLFLATTGGVSAVGLSPSATSCDNEERALTH